MSMFDSFKWAIRVKLERLLLHESNDWSPFTQVLLPGDEDLNVTVERWSVYEAPTFNAIIRPGNEEDVQKAVRPQICS